MDKQPMYLWYLADTDELIEVESTFEPGHEDAAHQIVLTDGGTGEALLNLTMACYFIGEL